MKFSVLPFIIVLIIYGRLRKSLKEQNLLPKWEKQLKWMLFGGIALFALGSTFMLETFTAWTWHLFMLLIVAAIYREKDFAAGRQLALGILPYIVVSIVEDIFKAISKDVFETVESYFSNAILVSVIWMITLWITYNRQQKALDKEREKRRMENEMNRAIAERKAQLEDIVVERTAELTRQKEALELTLSELKSTQDQLIQQEKLASLGELTAGIAHEIQNPLNFVNNFSEVSIELLDELESELNNGDTEEVIALTADIKQNLQKISQHGKRADSIVKGMLQHSRKSTGQKEQTDINDLADEYLRLSYHGLRAKDKSFNAVLQTDYDPEAGTIAAVPQELGRVVLNIINNSFYAVNEKRKQQLAGYEPTVSISTKNHGDEVVLRIRDNGIGIPQKVLDKIFQPFFTTKPTGEGTGLGLSLSYDIITKVHGGELEVDTKEGEFTEFLITLPRS
ncbi:sensor histidine kinase [Hufsiella ginkgonis]|uniref:histidine kinase n=1 Tax=Hufsiella ginkgonis TaxID=2695274 RepID=A0A7K1XWU5_9SPHI|nr:ATP-binding protein [Hufsiella ginkgonis]MXV15474.1 histidine kinase [Hufsiella ginkgonis]